MACGRLGWIGLAFVMVSVSTLRSDEIKRHGASADAGMAAAVVVEGCRLVHTGQLLPENAAGGDIGKQLDQTLARLERVLAKFDAKRDRVVKLNLYLAGAGARDAVAARLSAWFGADSLPAVCYVETPAPKTDALVSLDAIFALAGDGLEKSPTFGALDGGKRADWAVSPRGDAVYVAGQAEPGDLATATRATMEGLVRTLKHLGLGRERIVELKCFLEPMAKVDVVERELQTFFGDDPIPPVSHVEWKSGATNPIEIEAVAHAPAAESGETLSYTILPWMNTSPVYSRVATIHGDRRIYVSGLESTAEGDGESQVRGVFARLEDILKETGSDIRHLAKATYYVSDEDASGKLNAIRPSIYDPKRPPAASKAMTHGVGAKKRSLTIDMIAAPLPAKDQPAPKPGTNGALLREWQAGVAIATITPERPMMLAGFASRTTPSEGKATDLYAKALALKDSTGAPLVIVTMDLIGVQQPLRDAVAKRLQERRKLPPEALMLNASHTHCGPELAMTPTALEELSDERKLQTTEYCRRLEDKLVDLVERAIDHMRPAALVYSHARCGFAMNRRLKNFDPARAIHDPYLNHPNPDGPVDHDVPVLQAIGENGRPIGVVFGYACHNTTVFVNTFCGDYAGYAQRFVEDDHPGAVALFVTGCGGDQNGYPRGSLEWSQKHGRSLANAVAAATANRQRPVRGPLETKFDRVELTYQAPLSREQLESVAAGKEVPEGVANEIDAPHAKRLLRTLEREGKLRSSYDYPVQTIRLGQDLTLVALAGETTVDYSLRLKRELAGDAAVWVAGYCHEPVSYVPSRRLLEEGGYEPKRSMNYMTSTVHPGPWDLSIEERIVGKVKAMLEK